VDVLSLLLSISRGQCRPGYVAGKEPGCLAGGVCPVMSRGCAPVSLRGCAPMRSAGNVNSSMVGDQLVAKINQPKV
jgi:hypothetical protein